MKAALFQVSGIPIQDLRNAHSAASQREKYLALSCMKMNISSHFSVNPTYSSHTNYSKLRSFSAVKDILPLRRGHTLVVTKAHVPRLSDLSPELARAIGEAVSKVAQALTLGKLSPTIKSAFNLSR
jgi:diadenosine tetraphosphate (Ap4A) HIT family hydrolase